jgi:class 3 adenylate cyclase
MHRDQILDSAKALISGERDGEYGDPRKNFELVGARWSQILGVTVDPWQVALMMADLKIARAITGKHKDDTFLDLVGYAAIAGELAGPPMLSCPEGTSPSPIKPWPVEF